MGIFDKLFSSKSKEIPLVAPLSGEVVSIREVSDPTFGQEILGKGVAIRPTSNRVLAPCDGVIEMMFDTGHAVSLTSDTGAEILIHIGFCAPVSVSFQPAIHLELVQRHFTKRIRRTNYSRTYGFKFFSIVSDSARKIHPRDVEFCSKWVTHIFL